MQWARALTLPALVASILLCGACENPPEKEIDQAQGAIDAARAAGADQYAREEFEAAREALKHANEAVSERDYRLALNYALDSRAQAQNAAKNAADHKAMARAEAERALVSASAALETAHEELQAAESAPNATAEALADGRRAVADGEEAVQKARAALGRGEYATVAETLAAPVASLRAATREIEASIPSGPHRRR